MATTGTRAQGVLFGQLIGDSLGSLVEFRTAETIAREYPNGVRELADGGPFQLKAGQATDDSELALALARAIVAAGGYEEEVVKNAYRRWAATDPVDIGNATASALIHGTPSTTTEANGALMRISPVAVAFAPAEAARIARIDARLTHPHDVPVEINALYAQALSETIRNGLDHAGALECLRALAPGSLRELIEHHSEHLPDDYYAQMGWVKKAFGNLIYELAHPVGFEEALVRTVGRGGDTDTNAAITGAFLGGVVGAEQIPARWRKTVTQCESQRPAEYWATDLPELAEKLLAIS